MSLHDTKGLGAQKAAISGLNSAVRVNNALTYVSPTMGGFNARVDYAKDSRNADAAVAGKDATTDYQGLTLNYAQGPLSLSAATATMKSKAAHVTGVPAVFTTITNATPPVVVIGAAACTPGVALTCITTTAAVTAVDATNDNTEAKFNAISGQYKISPAFAVQASYGKNQFSTEGVVNHESSAYRLGTSFATGKWVLAAQYGAGTVKSPLANSNTNLGKATEADRTAYQLAAIYNLSKRTNLYAAYGMQEQEVTQQANNAAGNGDMTTAIGDSVKSTQMAVGVRHSF
jgi:predicted porin